MQDLHGFFFHKSLRNLHVILQKTRLNCYLCLVSKKKHLTQEREEERLLICNDYFLVLNFEGAQYRCKNLSQSDITFGKMLRS